jgi:translation initiation factor IF-3
MANLIVTGTIKGVSKLFAKGEFKKRDLIVTTDDQYPQVLSIEFVKEKEAELDFVEVGEKVTVSCNVRGREWSNTSGETKYFLSLQAWKMEKLG